MIVEKIKLPGFKELAASIYEKVPFEYFINDTKQVLEGSLSIDKHKAILLVHFLLKSIKLIFFFFPPLLWLTVILPEKFLPEKFFLPTRNLKNDLLYK